MPVENPWYPFLEFDGAGSLSISFVVQCHINVDAAPCEDSH